MNTDPPNKNRKLWFGLGKFIATLIAAPVIAGWLLLVLADQRAEKEKKEKQQAQQSELEREKVARQQQLNQTSELFQRLVPGAGAPYFSYHSELKSLVLDAGQYVVAGTITDYPVGAVTVADTITGRFIISALLAELNSSFLSRSPSGKITVELYGGADAVPVRAGATYKGEFGDFSGEYFAANTFTKKRATLISGLTPLSNELFGFLRCEGMRRELGRCPLLSAARFNYTTFTEERVGGKFRRVSVRIRIDEFFPLAAVSPVF